MPDTAAETAGTIFRLIYRSKSLIPAADRKHELGVIFSVARSRNKKIDVTGALLITDDQFVQALEGPEHVVRTLYKRICQDSRHEDVELLKAEDVGGRVFGRWAMAKVAADGEPDIALLTNVDKGGISPAQPRPVTTEQQPVLDFMHEALQPAGAPAEGR